MDQIFWGPGPLPLRTGIVDIYKPISISNHLKTHPKNPAFISTD